MIEDCGQLLILCIVLGLCVGLPIVLGFWWIERSLQPRDDDDANEDW